MTSGIRDGTKVVILDPFSPAMQTPDTFNPLELIDPATSTGLDSAAALIEELVMRAALEEATQGDME
jgi:type IV secretory pathway TraG/TraD family ATPase VirD4